MQIVVRHESCPFPSWLIFEKNIMWKQRYASEEFAYGTEPNSFLVQNAKILTGPVLSLAEGEGRNAVFLASLGLEVLGVDGAEAGLVMGERPQCYLIYLKSTGTKDWFVTGYT